MEATVRLDGSNRIIINRDLRKAAGLVRGQGIRASAMPGRIILEVEPASKGAVQKRGKLRVWSGEVPAQPLQEAVENTRRYQR